MKLLGITYNPNGTKCEACQHGIKNLYHISFDGKGTDLIVGSECVMTLDGLDQEAVDGHAKNLAKAGRQWKTKYPKPLDGEERGDYINRRLREMRRSRFAYQEMSRRLQNLSQKEWQRQFRDLQERTGSYLSRDSNTHTYFYLPTEEVLEIARVAECHIIDFSSGDRNLRQLKSPWELPYWGTERNGIMKTMIEKLEAEEQQDIRDGYRIAAS